MGNLADEEAVRRAIEEFYRVLDDLLLGKGNQALSDVWLHEDFVTSVHPLGRWAHNWQEVWATSLERH